MGLGYVSISRGSVQVLLASGHWIALDRSMVKWQGASGSFMGVYLSQFFSIFPKNHFFSENIFFLTFGDAENPTDLKPY